jgi:hypothetical protein
MTRAPSFVADRRSEPHVRSTQNPTLVAATGGYDSYPSERPGLKAVELFEAMYRGTITQQSRI